MPKRPSKAAQAEALLKVFLSQIPSEAASESSVLRAVAPVHIQTSYLKRIAAKWEWLEVVDGVWRLKRWG